jgi:Uncharacterized protein conserved in bacteria
MNSKKKNREFVGFSGDDLVKAVVNDKLELVQIDFQEVDFNPEDAYILEEMIVIAVNNALRNANYELKAVNEEKVEKD